MAETEEQRASELLEAQTRAEALFHQVEARGLIRPGVTEKGLNAEIYALAQELYGITTYWHKRIVRAGKNTLLPYADNPADHTIGDDDILFLDLGPVFEQWEADFGRTFVLGSDPLKLRCARTSSLHSRTVSDSSTIIPALPAANSSTTSNRSLRNTTGSLGDLSPDISSGNFLTKGSLTIR